MNKLFFTADTHFGHKNIINYARRPFKSVEEMDEVLIRNWNSVVNWNDKVVFVGDFCLKDFEKYRSRLNGEIIFVFGNHDYDLPVPRIIGLILEINGKHIYVTHYPDDLEKSFRINLVGHVHNLWKFKQESGVFLINVGVDVWNFKPVSFDTILEELKNWRKKK